MTRFRFLVFGSALGLVGLGLGPAAPPAHALQPAIGSFDLLADWADGTMRVAGWAASPDFPQQQLPIRVTIDGYLALPNYKIGNTWRWDVPLVIGSQFGQYLGFDKWYVMPGGAHTVCIQAAVNGVYNQIGACKPYTQGSSPQVSRIKGIAVPQGGPGQLVFKDFTINGTPTTYYSAIRAGAAAWFNSGTAVYFVERFSVSSADIYMYSQNSLVLGSTTTYPCGSTDFWSGGCTLSWAHVDYNTFRVGQLPGWAAQVATHELGHAVGLGHPDLTSIVSLMSGDVTNLGARQTIQPYDIESMGFNYPTSFYGP